MFRARGVATVNNLLRRLKSLATGTSDINLEVFSKLNELKGSGGRLSLRVAGDSNAYTCRISALNANHKMLVVSDFFPSAPAGLLNKAKPVTVVVTDRDRQSITLRCKYLEPLMENLGVGHQLKFCSVQREAIHSSRVFNLLPSEPVK